MWGRPQEANVLPDRVWWQVLILGRGGGGMGVHTWRAMGEPDSVGRAVGVV